MKTFLIALLGAIMMLFSLSSCTDQYDVEIEYHYNAYITVSAAHIFDSFQAVEENDFKLSEYPGLELELSLFLYDETGDLIYYDSKKSNSLETNLEINFDKWTIPISGKYKAISIARFCNDTDCFWEFWKPESLSTFIIRDLGQSNMPDVFETLGIDIRDISIGNQSFKLGIEVPPVTSLLQVSFHGQDLTGFGENGYSDMAPYCKEVNIWAPRLMHMVIFSDGVISYDYLYSTECRIANYTPQYYYSNGTNATVYNYKALLPIQDINFYGDLIFEEGTGRKFGLNDCQLVDYTSRLNLESGKQYDLDFLFDYQYILLQNHVPNENMNSKLGQLIDELNVSIFNRIMEWNFDIYVGESKTMIESSFGKGYIKNHSICYFDFDRYVYELRFNMDESMDTVESVYLQCRHLTDDFKARMIAYLTNRFTVYEKETDGHAKSFINANTLDNASIKIVWNSDKSLLTYEKLK